MLWCIVWSWKVDQYYDLVSSSIRFVKCVAQCKLSCSVTSRAIWPEMLVKLRKFRNRRNDISHLSTITWHIYSKAVLVWIWIGLMLAVVSRLFFYKSIAQRLLWNFADNFTNIKLISSDDFPPIWKYL